MNKRWDGLIAFYGTKDLELTHKFYNKLLELPLYKDQGECRIYNVPGGGMIGFCTHLTVVTGERSPIITLLAKDVDNIYARIVESGFAIPKLPEENKKFNIYHFFVKDPNGYTVEIQKFLD
jgi:predicted enzyme related to lactoylglutathione lyase